MADIALPSGDGAPVAIAEVSPTAAAYLTNFHEKMLRPESERPELEALQAAEDETPYIDPRLRSQLPQLAFRMARGGMLRGVEKVKSTVGLFSLSGNGWAPGP